MPQYTDIDEKGSIGVCTALLKKRRRSRHPVYTTRVQKERSDSSGIRQRGAQFVLLRQRSPQRQSHWRKRYWLLRVDEIMTMFIANATRPVLPAGVQVTDFLLAVRYW